MTTIKVQNYEPRMGTEKTPETPCGYINFTDGLRIGYTPGIREANEYGLFAPAQPYAVRHRDLTPKHFAVATDYVRETLEPALSKLAELDAANADNEQTTPA